MPAPSPYLNKISQHPLVSNAIMSFLLYHFPIYTVRLVHYLSEIKVQLSLSYSSSCGAPARMHREVSKCFKPTEASLGKWRCRTGPYRTEHASAQGFGMSTAQTYGHKMRWHHLMTCMHGPKHAHILEAYTKGEWMVLGWNSADLLVAFNHEAV